MIKVGLTGGIGSGKSTVAQVFKTLGVPVFDADVVAKRIMEEDKFLVASIKKAFGEEAYSGDKLNRKYIADIVFKDKYQLELLNSLTHPATIKAAEDWMVDQTTSYCIKEAALLFEAGTAGDLDYIIGVQAPDALRIKRVMQRDGITRQEVLNRMGKQIEQDIKMRLCDYVITNDEQRLLIPQVLELHNKLTSDTTYNS
jgi:dephospho-CoA kinase